MPYVVALSKQAKRDLEKVQTAYRPLIVQHLEGLQTNPRPPDSGALKGKLKGKRKLRVGVYRIIYEVHDQVLQVLVIRIVHRQGAY